MLRQRAQIETRPIPLQKISNFQKGNAFIAILGGLHCGYAYVLYLLYTTNIELIQYFSYLAFYIIAGLIQISSGLIVCQSLGKSMRRNQTRINRIKMLLIWLIFSFAVNVYVAFSAFCVVLPQRKYIFGDFSNFSQYGLLLVQYARYSLAEVIITTFIILPIIFQTITFIINEMLQRIQNQFIQVQDRSNMTNDAIYRPIMDNR